MATRLFRYAIMYHCMRPEIVKEKVSRLLPWSGRLRKTVVIAAPFAALLLLGYGFGAGCALVSMKTALAGRSPLLLFRPTQGFVRIYRSINSPDELERLDGYYAMREHRLVDEGFLIERFQYEQSPVVRRGIVWVLGFSTSRKRVVSFFAGLYPNTTPPIKLEILRGINRRGPDALARFRERVGADIFFQQLYDEENRWLRPGRDDRADASGVFLKQGNKNSLVKSDINY